jgi:NCK-associated protein 1
LNKTFLVTIYGDETFYCHEVFDDLFSKYKAASIALKKEKPILKASEDISLNCSRVHFKERTYLRLQLQTFLTMLKDFPGLAGPKFQLVMAALHLTKMEIYWYFTHYEKQPKKNAKKYRELPQTDLGELIHLIYEITSICREKKQSKTQTNFHTKKSLLIII